MMRLPAHARKADRILRRYEARKAAQKRQQSDDKERT